jgi:hypothetical protein
MGVEFIDIAHGLNSQRVFVCAAAITQTRGAIIACACSYFGKSMSHVAQNG